MADDAGRSEAEKERRRQQRAAHRARRHNERGRHFHLGMAQLRGETRENGWRHEQTVEIPGMGGRRHDTSRTVDPRDRQFTEYKSGETIRGKESLTQVQKDAHLVEQGWRGEWVMTDTAWKDIDRSIGRQLEQLQQQYPDRFRVDLISREQREQAIRLGKELDRNRAQPELFDSRELRARERVRQREERARQSAREHAEPAMAAQQMATQRHAREVTEHAVRQEQRDAAQRLAVWAREQREAAERGEPTPMTGREAADVLAVSRPTPGYESPHRVSPVVVHGRDVRGRERGVERDR